MSLPRKKVAIIGGGITGLSTAYFLQEAIKKENRPIDLCLVEASARLGGKITSERVDGFVIEGGPDSFITQKKWGMTLIRDLGLTDRLVQTHPVNKSVFILSKGRLVPMPQGFNLMVPGKLLPFALSPLISLPGKARMGMDLFIPKRASTEDESIASFVRRRLGEEAVQLFAEPILAGIFAGDAEKLSMKAAFPQFALLEQAHGSLIKGMLKRQGAAAKKGAPPPKWSLFVTLEEGLSSIVSEIRKRLDRVEIKTDSPVIAVSPLQSGYEVVTASERLTADSVVLTTPTYKAADWIQSWDGALSESLRKITYVSTATVSLGFHKKDVSHSLDGFGFVIPRREGSSMMASTWSSTKFPGRAPKDYVLIRVFMGGAYHQDVVDQSDTALIAIVRKELQSILGITAEPVVARAFRWHQANPQYHVGHLDLVSNIERETQKHPGLFLTGASYRGVGIPDCIQQGMETAE
ncbi:MAG: protoporphyrinogen oxidase, partial [Nitrospiria bacterium]